HQGALARDGRVEGGRGGAGGPPKLGQADPRHAVGVQQSQRLLDEQFAGEATAPQACHVIPFVLRRLVYDIALSKSLTKILSRLLTSPHDRHGARRSAAPVPETAA